MLEFKQIFLCKYKILIIFVLGGLIVSSKAMAQDPQRCTTDPFSHEILPLCGPGGDGGGTTIGPEDLLDFTQSPNGSWRVTDISQLVGIQVLGAPPSAIQVGSEYHVFVPNANNGHLQEFIRNACGIWSTVDLTSAMGQSFATSVPTAILSASGTEHVFVTGNGHLLDFVKSPNAPWTLVDVSVAVGLGSSSTFSPVGHVAVIQIGSDIHVYAFATDLEEYYLPAGGSWVFTDVSTAVGGGLQLEGSSLAATNTGSAVQVYIASSSGHVLNFQGANFTASGGSWHVFDQTANSGGSVRFAGFPYVSASPVVNSTGVYLFIDGGPNGVGDLEQMLEINGQWQTSDLSQTATNGTSLGLVSQPFALLDGNNFHVYTPGSGGHLYDFFKQPNANWVATDVSAITGPSLLGIGATSFRDATSGEFHVFENGTPASPQSAQPSACPTIPTVLGTSYKLGSTTNVVFFDPNRHVRQFSWNGSTWVTQDLTVTSGSNILAASRSGLTSFSFSTADAQAVYVGTNQHVYQLAWTGSTWVNQDLSAMSGSSILASISSAFTSFSMTHGTEQVVYEGADQHLYQLVWNGSAWINQDLTAISGTSVLAAPASGLTSFSFSTADAQVVYVGTNQHVYQLAWTGSTWVNQDLSAMSGSSILASISSAFTSFSMTHGTEQVVYEGADQHLYQLVWNGSAWINQDLTAISGTSVLAAPASGLTSFSFSTADAQVVYVGTNQHVYQLAWTGSTWVNQDLSAMSGSSILASTSSALTSFSVSSGTEQVVYQSTNQHIYELVWNGSAWINQDLTALGGNP